jgi:hypothetical protein
LDVRCWTLSVGRFLLLNLKGGELRCRVSRFVN